MDDVIYAYGNIPTPCFVVEEALLKKNLEILKQIREETGCEILLAQKCFSMYHVYPLLARYLSGTTASGLYEAKLGKECFGGETHVYSAAYRDSEIDELLKLCDHIVFNSFSQWKRYREKAICSNAKCGLRINPECSTQEGHAIYDPCAPYSRMGIVKAAFEGESLDGISGLHFHTLCEQNSDALYTTLQAVKRQFGDVLSGMEWINFGGGHHITRPDYDLDCLKDCIQDMQENYGLKVYLEPGEAVALNTGFMVTTVLDIVHNGMDIAIVDTSAACHMPDILEMPYTPKISTVLRGDRRIMVLQEDRCMQVQQGGEGYHCRLGGPTCLSGDIIGEYTFEEPLQVGDRILLEDMAIYSMVKTNTFNGMPLPSIAWKEQTGIRLLKQFGYDDFKMRL